MTRHQTFQDLHQQGCFIMPNPWDLGSAKMMAGLGAHALATSSAAHAFTLGLPDMGYVSREQAMEHAAEIVAATPLPVNGDLENGYGEAPETVAETIRLAAESGLSGCSIEDTSMDDRVVYDFDLAVERMRAAAAAAKALKTPFIFTARADGVMLGAYDMDEAIRRCQAYEAAGADMVYVPIPPAMADLARLVKSVNIPVNGLAAGPYLKHKKADFAAAGIRRISLGSAIARATHSVIKDSVSAMLDQGDFSQTRVTFAGSKTDALLKAYP